MNQPPDIAYQPPQPKEGLSTGAKWGIGCSVGCLFTLLIAGVISYVIYVKAKEIGTGILNEYTSETPIVFVAPEADQASIDDVISRYDAFSDAMKEGTETSPLTLSEADINLLIYHHPDWKEMAGHTSISIEDDQLTGQLSIPLDELGSLLKGRFLNGSATIRLSLSDGHLEGYMDSIEVANQMVPPEIISELQKDNIFKKSETDPEFREKIRGLDEIRIEGGELIIVPKPAVDRQPKEPVDPASQPVEKPEPVEA